MNVSRTSEMSDLDPGAAVTAAAPLPVRGVGVCGPGPVFPVELEVELVELLDLTEPDELTITPFFCGGFDCATGCTTGCGA